MCERTTIDLKQFDKVHTPESIRFPILYLMEADTTCKGEGVLMYIPFASPEDLIKEIKGD